MKLLDSNLCVIIGQRALVNDCVASGADLVREVISSDLEVLVGEPRWETADESQDLLVFYIG